MNENAPVEGGRRADLLQGRGIGALEGGLLGGLRASKPTNTSASALVPSPIPALFIFYIPPCSPAAPVVPLAERSPAEVPVFPLK